MVLVLAMGRVKGIFALSKYLLQRRTARSSRKQFLIGVPVGVIRWTQKDANSLFWLGGFGHKQLSLDTINSLQIGRIVKAEAQKSSLFWWFCGGGGCLFSGAIIFQECQSAPFWGSALVSRSRCGRKIARLRRLAAMVAASFLRF